MKRSAGNRLIDKIEDFTRVSDTLDAICCGLENGTEMPNYIPVCNDTVLTDQMTRIAEHINKLRKNLL